MSLEGRLEDLGLPDIFQIINLSRRSGVLTIIKKDGMGRIVFNGGNVVYASSDSKSRFGYTLLQKGFISRADLEKALTFQKVRSSKKPIGTILVEMGSMAKDALESELKTHIIDVVRDLLSWTTGTFQFSLGKFADEGVVMRSGISTEFLLLEGARLEDEAGHATGLDSAFAEHNGASAQAEAVDESTPMSPPQPDLKETLTGLMPDDGAPGASSDDALPSRKDLALLPSMIEELSGPVSGHDVILMMLRFASEMMNRAVMFLVRGDTAVGWGQFGVVVSEGSADEQVRSIAVPLKEASSCRDVLDKRQCLKGTWPDTVWNRYVIDRLGAEWPAESFLAPVVSNERVVALLYGDNLPSRDPIGMTDGLEAFLRVAGAALSKTLLQQQFQKQRLGGP